MIASAVVKHFMFDADWIRRRISPANSGAKVDTAVQ